MARIRRQRYLLTNASLTDGGAFEYCWTFVCALQEVPGAICWRCKRATRRGDHLVHIRITSDDTLKPHEIYHYRCIPPAKWHGGKFAGSLPAWDLPSEESPVEKAGTSSAVGPTLRGERP